MSAKVFPIRNPAAPLMAPETSVVGGVITKLSQKGVAVFSGKRMGSWAHLGRVSNGPLNVWMPIEPIAHERTAVYFRNIQ